MKKIVSVILVTVLLLCALPVCAEGISVYVNDVKLEFDVPPQIISGRTMVPMRKIFESLGAVVSWDAPTRTATGKKGDTTVNVSIDSKTLFKNGVPKALDVAPALIDGRTLVPARAIAESFDCQVDWIAETRTVVITTEGTQPASKPVLTASEVSERVSPSVFYIEVYDGSGDAVASGSGFFVSADGVAVTNYHVIADTKFARITTVNGDTFDVNNVIAFDEELDLAIIRVDKKAVGGKQVAGFAAATLGDSDNIKAGQTVYALGSPVGLQNTISNGIISNVSQKVGDDTFIQITAPISQGSSGGALVNEYGEVLGITSAGIEGAQNIGFAIPINVMHLFDLNEQGVSYSEFSSMDSAFTLELSSNRLELEEGQTVSVLVYAEGKSDDWSIYWDTKEENVVACEWGDWMEENTSVCTLYITGVSPGTATVTVYSDVDFQGQEITVTVKGKKRDCYPGTKIPTYTFVTGVASHDQETYETNNMYAYRYYDVDEVQAYVDYLLKNGFEFYKEEEADGSTGYYYITPDDELILVVLAYRWNEVWLYIPR